MCDHDPPVPAALVPRPRAHVQKDPRVIRSADLLLLRRILRERLTAAHTAQGAQHAVAVKQRNTYSEPRRAR